MKKYQKPTIEVIVIDSVSRLLVGSDDGLKEDSSWYETPGHMSDKQLS